MWRLPYWARDDWYWTWADEFIPEADASAPARRAIEERAYLDEPVDYRCGVDACDGPRQWDEPPEATLRVPTWDIDDD
jgi:hypothetical protein